MTPRQSKALLIILGACVGFAVLYWIVASAFVEPAEGCEQYKRQLRAKIADLKVKNAQLPQFQARYKKITDHALPGSEAEAASYLDAAVWNLRDCAHLGGGFTKTPFGADKKPKFGFKEIGLTIAVHGELSRLVDLMYLLEAQPFLHRLDIQKLTRQKNGEFDLSFNYLALAIDAKTNKRTKPTSQPSTDAAPPVQNLDTPERRRYDAIAARDIFRPYVKRIVEPPPPPPPTRVDDPPKVVETPKPRRAEFFVCGLVTWDDGRQQVVIRNGSTGEVRDYKPGDKVEGAEVVMIDYRPMPKAGNPNVDSPSRLILKIGQEYWAVELERSLSDKHLLKPDQLPPELRPPAASEPGVAATGGNAS